MTKLQTIYLHALTRARCCLYKMKLGTRRTAATATTFLNNGLACVCFTALLRLPHMRRAIELNLEGISCELSNQSTVGPAAMASRMCRPVCSVDLGLLFHVLRRSSSNA